MRGFTLMRLGRIRNKWIRDALSEILSTFILALFVYASGAQFVLSRGSASSASGKALAAGCGLTLAVYAGFNASGGCVNPCIALMFCLTGKLPWKKWPMFVLCHFIGAYIAAALTYGIYNEMIDMHEGGHRTIYGENNTGSIFMTFPAPGISKTTGFLDVMVGCGLLTGTTCFVIDSRNSNPAPGLIPFIFTFVLYGILMCFGINTGSPINLSIDMSGRLLAWTVGYGDEVFTHADYWCWVPPVACVCGTLVSCTIYQLMIGNHLPEADDWDIPVEIKPKSEVINTTHKSYTESDLSLISNGTSITTLNSEKF